MTDGMLPTTIYHYCSLETFHSIITNKTIRLSDISKSNDYLELRWASMTAKEVLDETYAKLIHSSKNEQTSLYQNLYEKCEEFLSILIPTPFVCCFSQQPDLLSQWRGYASDGSGIAIGVNPSRLVCDSPLYWKKVEYSKEVMHDNFTNTFNRIFSEETLSIAEEDKRAWRASAHLMGLRDTYPHYKNSAFYEEQEYRLIYRQGIPIGVFNLNFTIPDFDLQKWIKKTDYKEYQLTQIQHSPKGNKLVPYIDLSFDKIKNDFVQEVIIGPKCDLEIYDVKTFLGVNGYDLTKDNISVFKSQSSYK